MTPTLLRLFDLRHDQDDPDAIDAAIRDGVRVGGTNLWVLIFAILIASIGLNVNSPAVIIGAMLISPLMGPIIGVGYGAGINDFPLIRTALRNLGIFAGLSLLASTVYFLLSPLSLAQSELLARTTPTLWDVLVAFFGGAAGIVAATRRQKSPVIPGVAIATALMPPICTAGYGLATANLEFFLGAFYLFSINGVFIALATLAFVKLLKLPQHRYIDDATRGRARLVIFAAVAATALPSAYLAYRLVQNEFFVVGANRMLAELDQERDITLLAREVLPGPRTVAVTLAGDDVPADMARRLEKRLGDFGLGGARVTVRHPGSEKLDVSSLKKELQQDLYQNTLQQLEQASAKLALLEEENRKLREIRSDHDQLVREIQAQYPDLDKVAIALEALPGNDGAQAIGVVVVASGGKPVAAAERERLGAWLKVRLTGQPVRLVLDVPAVPPAAKLRPGARRS